MIRWYGDNSELRGIWGAEIPDILLFGGILIDDASTGQIVAAMNGVKSEYYEDSTFPLKWNFRDLEDHYQERGLQNLYSRLLADSRTWRINLFDQIAPINFKVFVSMISSYGSSRETLLRTRDEVARFVFVMALQRLGLCIRNHGACSAELVLDWPAERKRNLFDLEYRSALLKGYSADYAQGYDSGPLKNLGFGESVLFTSTVECSMLQLSDLVVGATRDLVEESLGRRQDSLGVELLKKIRNRFEGAPDNVLGRGLPIHPRQGAFYERVRDKVASLYA